MLYILCSLSVFLFLFCILKLGICPSELGILVSSYISNFYWVLLEIVVLVLGFNGFLFGVFSQDPIWVCFNFSTFCGCGFGIAISCLVQDNGDVYGQIFSPLALNTLG